MSESERYVFEEDMAEISGFGGDYEQACRDMLKAGLEYWDEHTLLNPVFKGFKGIYGVLEADNEDAKKLREAILSATDDCTGAMIQAVITSIMWIRKNSWNDYVLMMKKVVKNDNDGNV